MSLLNDTLDLLIESYSQGQYAREVVAAREEYGERAGKVFEDDELYEARITSFLEWYVTERALDDHGVPPAMVEFMAADLGDKRDALWALASSYRSLFEVKRLGNGVVALKDLLGGCPYEVEERRKLHGVEVGDVMEARLIAGPGGVRFGRTFLFHPKDARESIVLHAERIQAEGGRRQDVVDQMASLRLRADRYRSAATAAVYEQRG